MGSLPKVEEGEAAKPHAVCVPYPAQGHINPMLKLAKILHSKGFHITFVNNEYNHNRLLRSRGPAALDGLPSFRFETITDGLPPTDADSTQDIPSLCVSTERHSLQPFKELLHRLNNAGGGVPPVTCVVSDTVMFFALDAAKELGVPGVQLWTASACGLLGYALYEKLVRLGLVPFKDENFLTNGDLDLVLDWVPNVKGFRMRDIPSFIRTIDSNDLMLNFLQRMVRKSKQAAAILFNSFDTLEDDVFKSLSSEFPPLYSVGPLQLLLDRVVAKDEETKSIGTNLWKEDPHCLDWLDSYGHGSVVYVNFGSITVMSNDQLVEFAWGLANSKHPFLWITRPDLVTGDSPILPPGFLEETKSRGLITSWCNQEQVLAHPAIGGFLTHCGWNSTLESICNGVPLICWPFFAEQQTNCWFSCRKWGIGMEIDTNVKRSEVERQVGELIEGEKGKEMKRKAMEWKALAQVAANSSSHINIDKLISKVLCNK